MRHKLVSIIILVLVSSCSSVAPEPSGAALFPSTNTPLPAQTPTTISTDISAPTETATVKPEVKAIDLNPETFRTVEWDYLISPAYLGELQRKEKAGELPSVSKDAVYVKPGFVNYMPDNPPNAMLINYGSNTIFSLSNETVLSEKSRRPYVLVDICRTKIKGEVMIFYVNQWKNSDNTYGYLAHFVPDSKLAKEVGLEVIAGQAIDQYPTGGFFVKTEKLDGFDRYMKQWGSTDSDHSDIVKYYYDNKGIFLPEKIYYEWQRTGILTTNKSLPVSPAGTNKIN